MRCANLEVQEVNTDRIVEYVCDQSPQSVTICVCELST